jgi:hypothetical protein
VRALERKLSFALSFDSPGSRGADNHASTFSASRNPSSQEVSRRFQAKKAATASTVRSISSSPCAVERNIASF